MNLLVNQSTRRHANRYVKSPEDTTAGCCKRRTGADGVLRWVVAAIVAAGVALALEPEGRFVLVGDTGIEIVLRHLR